MEQQLNGIIKIFLIIDYNTTITNITTVLNIHNGTVSTIMIVDN